MNIKAVLICFWICFISSSLANVPINLSEDQKHQLAKDLDDCIKEANVTATEGKQIKNWDIEDNQSNAFKCISACFFEKFGILKDNQIQEEVAAEKLKPIINERRTQELISKCRDLQAADRCETGFKIFQCVWNYRAF